MEEEKKRKRKEKKASSFASSVQSTVFDLSKHCRLRSKAHYPPDLMGYEHCLVAK